MDDDILIADKTIPELSVRVGQWLEADDLITIAGGTDRSCELASIRADVENDVDAVFQQASYDLMWLVISSPTHPQADQAQKLVYRLPD
jgi:hypothetical protein